MYRYILPVFVTESGIKAGDTESLRSMVLAGLRANKKDNTRHNKQKRNHLCWPNVQQAQVEKYPLSEGAGNENH